MKNFLRCLIPLFALLLMAGSRKQAEITIRFHTEANRMDGERFAQPVQLRNPPRQTYIERVPSVNERQIKAMFPFQAPDGTWGCAFQLDPSGRMNLEVLSTERRGSSLVVFVGTMAGSHQVIDMLIDKVITDGIISIPNGLTEMEIAGMKKSIPVMGETARRK